MLFAGFNVSDGAVLAVRGHRGGRGGQRRRLVDRLRGRLLRPRRPPREARPKLHIKPSHLAWADRWFERYGARDRLLLAHAADHPHVHLAAGRRRADAVLALHAVHRRSAASRGSSCSRFIGKQAGDNWEKLEGQPALRRLRGRGADRASAIVCLVRAEPARARGGDAGRRCAALSVVALGLLQGPAELLPVSSSGARRRAAAAAGLASTRAWRARSARSSRSRCTRAGRRLVVGLRRGADARCRCDVALLSTVAAWRSRSALERLDRGAPRRRRARWPAGLVAGSLALVLADRRRRPRREEDAGPRDGAAARARAGVRAGAGRLAQRRDARGGAGARVRAARRRRGSRARSAVPVLAGATALKGTRLRARRPGRGSCRARRGRADRRAATLAAMPLARVLERDRPLAPWAAYRCGLAAGPARARESRAMSGRLRRLRGRHARRRPRRGGARRRAAHDRDRRAPRAPCSRSGHYAAVLEVAPNLGIAVGTDGVGSKLIVAEQTGRYDTVGIDCVAMNVNDVVCVGAEPIALLDYLAVERADPEVHAGDRRGPEGGRRAAGVEIPGGEVARAAGADPRATRRRTASTSTARVLRHRRARRDGHRRRAARPATR